MLYTYAQGQGHNGLRGQLEPPIMSQQYLNNLEANFKEKVCRTQVFGPNIQGLGHNHESEVRSSL